MPASWGVGYRVCSLGSIPYTRLVFHANPTCRCPRSFVFVNTPPLVLQDDLRVVYQKACKQGADLTVPSCLIMEELPSIMPFENPLVSLDLGLRGLQFPLVGD